MTPTPFELITIAIVAALLLTIATHRDTPRFRETPVEIRK